MRIVGWTLRDDVVERDVGGIGDRPFGHPRGRLGIRRPARFLHGAPGVNEATAVEEPDLRPRFRKVLSGADHGGDELFGDPGGGRAGAEDHHALLGKWRTGDVESGKHTRQSHRPGALNVVVEHTEPVAIPVQQRPRVRQREVLPLEQDVGESPYNGLDERLDELVVCLAAHALMSPSQVQRIVEKTLVVRSDVERHRQGVRGVDAGADRVQRELPHGDPHPAHTQIAQPEDPLAVGDHDHLHVPVLDVVEDRVDLALLRVGDVEAAWAMVDVAVAQAGVADHRRVDDRDHLSEVLAHEPVEQHLVAVEECHQVQVALQVVMAGQVVGVRPLELQFRRRDPGW